MRKVIKSAAESGDGVSIEREQPSTTSRSMPHFPHFGDTRLTVQPEKDSFGSFEPRQAKLQEASTNDDLTGRKGLNWGEICDVGTSLRQADELTGTFNALNETTNFDDKGFSPISGEGVFKPQDIDAKGSVIVGDNHFMPGRGGDSLTGEGRPTKIWTNGGASTFEDRWELNFRDTGYEGSGTATCSNTLSPGFDAGRNEHGIIIDNPGTAPHIGANSGPGGSTYTNGTSQEGVYFMTETFKPAAGMDFAGSLNPVLEVGTNSGPGGTTFMKGQFDFPTNNLGGSASPGGDDI